MAQGHESKEREGRYLRHIPLGKKEEQTGSQEINGKSNLDNRVFIERLWGEHAEKQEMTQVK